MVETHADIAEGSPTGGIAVPAGEPARPASPRGPAPGRALGRAAAAFAVGVIAAKLVAWRSYARLRA